MVTILFRCPKCDIHCIRRITCTGEAFAIASLLPVLVACWNCRTASLAMPKDKMLPREGVWDSLRGHCQRIAEACAHRATEAKNPYFIDIYRRMQQGWLNLAHQSRNDQVAALIGASVTPRAASAPSRWTA